MKLNNKQIKNIVTKLVKYNPEIYYDNEYFGDTTVLDKKEFIDDIINSLAFKNKLVAALTLFEETGNLRLDYLLGDLLWNKRFISALPKYKENLKKVKTTKTNYQKQEKDRVSQIKKKEAVKLLKSWGYRVDKVK